MPETKILYFKFWKSMLQQYKNKMKILILLFLIYFVLGAPAPRVIKSTSSNKVYLVLDGKKSWIPDPACYNRIIVTSQNKITIVPNIQNYPNGPDIDTNAQLIRGIDSPAIYLAQFGRKRWIVSPAVFNSLGFDWNKVRVVDHWVIQLFPSGPSIN